MDGWILVAVKAKKAPIDGCALVLCGLRVARREKLSESPGDSLSAPVDNTPAEDESWLMSAWHLVWPRRKRVFVRTIEAKYTVRMGAQPR